MACACPAWAEPGDDASVFTAGSTKKPCPPKKGDRPKKPDRAKLMHGFTPEREAAALTFVKQHHEELVQLLQHLKKQQSKEYYQAIKELFRTSERLAMIQERDVQRYELELKSWKTKSRIQLLVTRLKITPDDARLQAELKRALLDQIDLRLGLLKQDHRQLIDRANKLEDQIKKMTAQREQMVEKQMKALARPPKRPPAKEPPRRPKHPAETK